MAKFVEYRSCDFNPAQEAIIVERVTPLLVGLAFNAEGISRGLSIMRQVLAEVKAESR